MKSTPFCLSEARSVDSLGHHDLVSNLFEPNDSLRRLKLPILQWPGDYQPSSAEGRFLTHLGLRSAPTYLELVEIMYNTRTDLPLRDYAFRYFIENHHTKGYDSYNHSNVSLPYLPLQGQEKLEKPSSCFTNERVAIMGFSILRRDLHQHAAKFGVRSDPPMQECINRLIINPPRTSKSARELFEYFASRPNEIDQSCSEILSNSSIVPVFSKSTGLEMRTQKVEPVRHIPPRICFLGTDKKYAGILDYVDFGQLANTFLLHCGSKHEPNISELGTMLMREPARIFTLLEIPRYTDLLRHLAQSWPHLKNNKGLVKQMRTVKFLLAHREHPSSNILKGENIDDEDDQSVRTAELASASQIVVVDDNITYKQFKTSLLVAPFEDVLEEFYFNLGSPELGSLVQEHHSIGVTAHNQNAAYDLQKLIQERTRLFLHDLAPDLIKHDAKWIDENLSVIVVKSISLRKTLKGHSRSHNESRSAAVHSVKDGCTLSVTPKFDLFEVSQVLVPLLVNRSRMDHTLVLESLLSTDLLKLQARGYNVQRILRRKAQEAQVAEDERNKQLAQEAQDLKDQEKKWNEEKAQKAAELKKQQSMPGLFPDSPDHKQPKRVNQLPPPEEDRTVQRPRGFFSDIGKRLGLENGRHPLLHNRPNNNGFNEGAKPVQSDSPPPYSQEDLSKIRTAVPQPETVTAPHHLQQK